MFSIFNEKNLKEMTIKVEQDKHKYITYFPFRGFEGPRTAVHDRLQIQALFENTLHVSFIFLNPQKSCSLLGMFLCEA